MDRDDMRRNFTRDLESQDTYDTRQAKQRASIKWLLSKAYNNKVPENLKEPFYKDHEDQEHVKPQIVHNLANAELYCLAFANIYSDPNYHNLNHWGILQTLSRKGVNVPDTSDGPITETVLIKTTPIKLVAHIAVMESLMELYAKEVVTPDRVLAAVNRFTHGAVSPAAPADTEEGLLLWVNQAQAALVRRISLEGGTPPNFPPIRSVKGLSDGAGLAALISFYCPEELPWQEIKVPALPTVSDSVHNLCLVHEFSHHSLPSTVCHMMPEDVTYLHGNMQMNLLVLLADLFNVLEIHPVKCVRFPGHDAALERNSQGVAHKRSLPQPITGIPDLRSHLSSQSSFTVSKLTGGAGLRKSHSTPYSETTTFAGSPDSLDTRYIEERRGEDFVVHRGRAIQTLSSMIAEDPLIPARLRPNKERGNQDSKGEERGEGDKAAGRPSNWEEKRRTSYAGRRSRRNSLSDDSQLTLENFGGSQENLHFLGRNPDKDPAVLSAASLSSSPAATATRTSAHEARSDGIELIFAGGDQRPASPVQRRDSRKSPSPAAAMFATPSVPVRSSQEDARSTAIDRIFADNGYGIEKRDEEKKPLRESEPREVERERPRDLYKDQRDSSSFETSHVSLNNLLHSKAEDCADGDISGVASLRRDDLSRTNGNNDKKNTTTWQQQQRSNTSSSNIQQVPNLVDENSSSMQLHNIRLKLEEKRRVIESEKKKMELVVNKQRQKVGKAAFLQAVTKKQVKPQQSESKNSDDLEETELSPISTQDMREEPLERNWMDSRVPFLEEKRTPDSEHIDMEQFQQSIAQMDNSLSQIDSDMKKLYLQETQLMTDKAEERLSQQFKDFTSQQNKKIANLVNQQQKLQTFAIQMAATQNKLGNQTYTTFASASPPAKPLSLSQLHHQNTSSQSPQPSNQSPQQFFLHEQPRRTTWREQSDQVGDYRVQPEPFRLANGNTCAPTPPPRSGTASPLHSRSSPMSKPIVPPRQTSKPSPAPAYSSPLPAPSVDDMAPQSICFIGDEDADGGGNRAHINISSGSRTYRIPSPTRPHPKHPFLQKSPHPPEQEPEPEKGFYISFDDAAPPKRPKPPLRGKRSSPKKDRYATQVIESSPFDLRNQEEPENLYGEEPIIRKLNQSRTEQPPPSESTISYSPVSRPESVRTASSNYGMETPPRVKAEPMSPGVGLVIGSEPDPNAVDEMEKKKEKILLLSLQRRQQQEELKAQKEAEAHQRRELKKLKDEELSRKKAEEKARRDAIYEQFKLKKAIEEAEREGKVVDKAELLKLAAPKMRGKPSSTPRPRPKTIHVESGSAVDSGMLAPSRGNKGSSQNLAERSHENSVFSRPLRRDYYRGSQDSLAGSTRGRPRESPSDDGRGISPSRSGNSNLGRRGSYKTSRDTSEPPQSRVRSKYSTYQPNFRNRKSNSLVNLSGSSTDQDSLLYRYGDTDSGLGRATPPRRAPSPGFNRHLTSPSGPGSLPPGLISKRRVFDDGASDISSNASSMMDYSGPRLYKQPTIKSNRGIMLNAVEYCVFPGYVNKEAKQRVLEEISHSESRHFLILFRDAGCQFRALYSYCPDTEEIHKLYGTGPKQVNDSMFDRFFKYNSGGKCFSQVHTKHLTVTIDAFTIHNSLWQGKKVNLPSKKDMALVI